MADLVAVAGGKFYIGGVKTYGNVDWVEADYASQVWVEVDGWQTRGDLGDTSELLVTPLINRGRDAVQKGTFNAGSMENGFTFLSDDAGQLAMTAASKTRLEYAFRAMHSDTAAVKSSTFTVTIAAPGVVTWTAHGLLDGTKVTLSTTGALPTGLAAATTYYIVSKATNTFQLSLTKGGAAITTSGSQSGVHTVTTQPTPTTEYFTGKVMGAQITGGGANDLVMLKPTIAIASNVLTVTALG